MRHQSSMAIAKAEVIRKLRDDILHMQGFTAPEKSSALPFGLSPIEAVFPNGIFPTGTIHEFLNTSLEHAAASSGFLAGLLSTLMQYEGACLWISHHRTLFPTALPTFGVSPDRIIFIDLKTEKDVLWATEEALKCEGISAVIAELGSISFAQSRRLQLVVEHSKVTGFILRKDAMKIGTTACTARWQVTPLPTEPEYELPGLGHPRWKVELLKVRNGHTGSWILEWGAEGFQFISPQGNELSEHNRKTG